MRNRITGLDGLRGIAVLAVLLYHADFTWAKGGFLGVDVFFVLSGFLITNLLLEEISSTGRIDRAEFYLRRMRRLFPALLLLLVVLMVLAAFVVPDTAYVLGRDLPWALSFTLNWAQLLNGQSYFIDLGRPALLQHVWSLAIEEQFYVIWPLVLIGLHKLRTAFRPSVFVIAFAGAIGSTWWMWHLADLNSMPIPVDPSRVYFGTDTHVMGLLTGSALAALWQRDSLRARVTPDRKAVMTSLGLLTLGSLLWCFYTLDEMTPWLYRGGFFVVSLITATLIVVAAHPASRIGLLLGTPVLRWLGNRSYGIYLWHWPIFNLLRPGVDVTWPDAIVFAARIGLTLIVADASYRLLELPIRQGRIRSTLAKWRRLGVPVPRRASMAIAGALIATVTIAGASVATATAPTAQTVLGGITALDDDPKPPKNSNPTPTPSASPSYSKIVVFGDSVVLSARVAIKEQIKGVSIDAAVGRQPSEIAERIAIRKAELRIGPQVVIHMGTNGIVTPEDLAPILDQLTDQERVVVVNVSVPRKWMKGSNAEIARAISTHPNVRLADWASLAKGHRKWFTPDGVHLNSTGGKEFAHLIEQTLAAP